LRIIAGRISGWVNNPWGEVNGIVLSSGQRVRFSPDRSGRALAAAPGSRVEVSALGGPEDAATIAFRIVNLDSRQYATLYAAPTPNSPEASTDLCPPPGMAVPLAPASTNDFESLKTKYSAPEARTIRREVANEIEQARYALHLMRTMLAH
jgi:hypothetical protein